MKISRVTLASILCAVLGLESFPIYANEQTPIYEDIHDEITCQSVDGIWNEYGVCEVKVEGLPVQEESTTSELKETEPQVEEVKPEEAEDVEEKEISDEESVEDTKEEVVEIKEEPKVEEVVVEPVQSVQIIQPIIKVTRATEEQINRYVKPDFSNMSAYGFKNPYTSSWVGQCTWYTWGRFVEVYGYDPGFTGCGYECAVQLVLSHPDAWTLSDTPVVGSIFSADSAHNHVGMIVGIEDNLYIVQEGNLNGRNDSWDEVETDCWTQTYTMAELKSCYGNVVFANPKNGVDEAKLLVHPKTKKVEIKAVLTKQFDHVLGIQKFTTK